MGDFKGVGLFCREFLGRYLEFEVSCFKPDFVSDFPGFEAREGSFLHALLCQFVGSLGLLPCILNLVELLLESQKEGLSEGWV